MIIEERKMGVRGRRNKSRKEEVKDPSKREVNKFARNLRLEEMEKKKNQFRLFRCVEIILSVSISRRYAIFDQATNALGCSHPVFPYLDIFRCWLFKYKNKRDK